MEDRLGWKMTLDGRHPWIEDDPQWKTTFLGKYDLTLVKLGDFGLGDMMPNHYTTSHSALRHF